MKEKISWKDKYEITLQEHASIKDIQKILDYGQPKAIVIRNKTIEYCDENNIFRMGKTVPMDALLIVTGKTREYFRDRMKQEKEILS